MVFSDFVLTIEDWMILLSKTETSCPTSRKYWITLEDVHTSLDLTYEHASIRFGSRKVMNERQPFELVMACLSSWPCPLDWLMPPQQLSASLMIYFVNSWTNSASGTLMTSWSTRKPLKSTKNMYETYCRNSRKQNCLSSLKNVNFRSKRLPS